MLRCNFWLNSIKSCIFLTHILIDGIYTHKSYIKHKDTHFSRHVKDQYYHTSFIDPQMYASDSIMKLQTVSNSMMSCNEQKMEWFGELHRAIYLWFMNYPCLFCLSVTSSTKTKIQKMKILANKTCGEESSLKTLICGFIIYSLKSNKILYPNRMTTQPSRKPIQILLSFKITCHLDACHVHYPPSKLKQKQIREPKNRIQREII